MCNRCPGEYKTVMESAGLMSSSYTSSQHNEGKPKTVPKKILTPCMCHCDVNIQHIESQNNREYCPVCHHYLRK